MRPIRSLQWARGFTVLLMAPVHTVLLYSLPAVRDSWLGRPLAFIAEGPGAQLFMLLMGIFFVLSKKETATSVLQKAVCLLLLGYALNVLKFVIPWQLDGLPFGLQEQLQLPLGLEGMVQVFMTSDILHFAALALLVLYAVSRLPQPGFYACVLALLICFMAPAGWDLHSANPVWDYLLQLLGGQPPVVYFPLLPWLVYPLLGLAIGHFLKTHPPYHLFGLLGMLGLFLLFTGTLLAPRYPVASFYRTYPADTLYHIGIVFVWLAVWQWVADHTPRNWFFRGLGYLSDHITQVYIIQWVLICWLLPLAGFQRLNVWESLAVLPVTSFLTLFISLVITAAGPKGIVIEA